MTGPGGQCGTGGFINGSRLSSYPHQDPDGGVPEGRVPDGGVPEGAVPLPGPPDGGVPDGRVPFICIPAGGVPEGVPADWLNRGLSPLAAGSDEPDDASLAGCSAEAVFVTCACASDDAGLPLAWAAELPESVQPITKIPAMRIADAISINIVLFLIEFISRTITALAIPVVH